MSEPLNCKSGNPILTKHEYVWDLACSVERILHETYGNSNIVISRTVTFPQSTPYATMSVYCTGRESIAEHMKSQLSWP